jgi:hypothetical protein
MIEQEEKEWLPMSPRAWSLTWIGLAYLALTVGIARLPDPGPSPWLQSIIPTIGAATPAWVAQVFFHSARIVHVWTFLIALVLVAGLHAR